MANSTFHDDLLRLCSAELADIGAVMALERGEGFEAFVGRSSRAEHEEMLASARYAYFLGRNGAGALVAFAILRDLDDPHGNVYLKRVAVDSPGRGRGSHFLALLFGWTFRETAAHRIYLDCFDDNVRAERAYQKLGLRREGVLRGAYLAQDGRRRDLHLMAVTRPEWLALPGSHSTSGREDRDAR
jgi:RimJ/RimL family protein N-acetyltransferase